MGKGRLEAFSDGVIAIIITIMVLELKVSHGDDIAALAELTPVLICYVLSYIYVGIYWNNHHHMLHAARQVNGLILWANLHFLFWLSLIPAVTGWMGENHFAEWPVALYGVILLMSAISYYLLSQALIRHHGLNSALAIAVGKDRKGIISVLIYIIAIALAFVNRWGACGLYVLVAMMWLIPDRRIERHLPMEKL